MNNVETVAESSLPIMPIPFFLIAYAKWALFAELVTYT